MLFRAVAAAALAVTVGAQGIQSAISSAVSGAGSLVAQTTNVASMDTATMNTATSPAGIPSPTSTDSVRQPPVTLVTGTGVSGSAQITSLSSQTSSATMSMSTTMGEEDTETTSASAASASMAGSDNAAGQVGAGHIHALGGLGVVAAGVMLL